MGNIIKDVKSAYDYLMSSPMFKLSLSSKELFHSNFLEWLSNANQDDFKKLILSMAGIEENYEWPNVWRVKREYNNFDLCVVAYDQYDNNEDEKIDDDEDFRILFVIENKVKSIPYKEQLERYAREAEAKNIAYWKKRGNDLFGKTLEELKKRNRSKNENYWIGIENNSWVLKIKSETEKKDKWSDVTGNVLMSATDDETGKKNKTDFIECYVNQNIANKPSINYILLSLAKKFPEYVGNGDWQIERKDGEIKRKVTWKVCNYSDYKTKIENTFKDVPEGLNKQIIEDYCNFINCLTTLSSEWEKDYEEKNQETNKFHYSDNNNYKKAHQFRIHDLYQKLKFSYLCTQLFISIKNKYGKKYEVFPSNQGGLFKEKNKLSSDKNYICVNYTYLHGEPLLEINVHPECENGVELYYAIQVQGNAYEHGIQVKKNDDTISKLKRNQERVFSEMVWNSLENKSIKIIQNWMNIYEVSKWEKAEWMDVPNKENKCYNKYDMNDGTYVYQKYLIQNNVTIEKVLDQMLLDLKQFR